MRRRFWTSSSAGKQSRATEEVIPPLGIVARESTQTVAFKDARLCQAIEYLNKNIEDPIGVQELASQVGVSRRWMEYAFRDALKESPYQYIRNWRLKLAQSCWRRSRRRRFTKWPGEPASVPPSS